MSNKVLVKLYVPEIEQCFDVLLPVNKKIGNIINLLNKAINNFSNGKYELSYSNELYNAENCQYYHSDILLVNTDIRNGTKLILVSS